MLSLPLLQISVMVLRDIYCLSNSKRYEPGKHGFSLTSVMNTLSSASNFHAVYLCDQIELFLSWWLEGIHGYCNLVA